jgi:hypothetical protein
MSALSIVKTEVPDRQSALHEKRAALESEYQRISKPEATRAAAAAAVGAAEEEIRALDVADREAWASWAAGSTDKPPEPNHKARQDAERRRALAAVDLRGAEAAASAVLPRQTQILAELRALGPQLFAIRLESIMDEVQEIENALVSALRAQAENRLKIRGLMAALDAEQSDATARNDEERASAVRAAMRRVASFDEPTVTSTYGDIVAASATWKAKLK